MVITPSAGRFHDTTLSRNVKVLYSKYFKHKHVIKLYRS